MRNGFIFQNSPIIELSTVEFINVPVILKYHDTNLIEVIKDERVGYTTEIPIYHSDGTYLAKLKGNRLFKHPDGEKAGVVIDRHLGLIVCRIGTQTVVELRHKTGDSFKASAELHTPEGSLVKFTDINHGVLIDPKGLVVNNLTIRNYIIEDARIGIWVKEDFTIGIGAPFGNGVDAKVRPRQ